MAYQAHFAAYSGSDWIEAMEAIDTETNQPLDDFDTSEIEVAVRDRNNSTILSATTEDGSITRPASGQIRWWFTASQMSALCPGTTYGVGVRMTSQSGSVALIAGSLAYIDGEF